MECCELTFVRCVQCDTMARPSRFFRISLLSFILLVSLICVSVSHVQVTRDNVTLRQRVTDLEDDLGFIKVEDPDKVYVRQLESVESLTWRFRIYLPPNKRYMIKNKIGRGGSGSSLQLDEQVTLTVGLKPSQRVSPDGWEFRYVMPGRAGGGMADAQAVSRMLASDVFEWAKMRHDTREFAADSEIELLSLSKGEVRVWLEPDRPRKKQGR